MPTIEITKGDIFIKCDDVTSAAALVNLLSGSAPPASPLGRPVKVPKPSGRTSSHEAVEMEPPTEGRGAIKARIFTYIEDGHPIPDIHELSELLYGENTGKSRARTSVAISQYVKRGSLKKLANGSYKVA